MSAVIELKNVSRVYRNGRGLHETTLSVNEGEIIGLLGVNGSGKTTLMKIACGMTRPDTGEAYIGGENVYISPEKALKAVGAVIETPALIRYGQLTHDEYFVSAKAAKEGVVIENLSESDPIVMLKHFAENPDLDQ